VFARVNGPVIAVERVPRDEISSYGVIAIEPSPASVQASTRCEIWSKAAAAMRRPQIRHHGRYILRLHLPSAPHHRATGRKEIQLTNGLRELLKSRPIYACEVKSVRQIRATSGILESRRVLSPCGGRISQRSSRPTSRRSTFRRPPASANFRSSTTALA